MQAHCKSNCVNFPLSYARLPSILKCPIPYTIALYSHSHVNQHPASKTGLFIFKGKAKMQAHWNLSGNVELLRGFPPFLRVSPKHSKISYSLYDRCQLT